MPMPWSTSRRWRRCSCPRRSGILADGNNGFCYRGFDSAIRREGDMFTVLDVLARDVGILGIFLDWPATTTFYANCAGMR